MSGSGRAGVALALGLALVACRTPGLPRAELPDDPIAIVYRSPEESRRRLEDLEQRSEGTPSNWRGVASVDDIADYVSELLAGSQDAEKDAHGGRLALLQPSTGAITLVAAARPGAVPQTWSPDRERLLFSQVVEGVRQLFEFLPGPGDVRLLTRGPRAHPEGCYGPDGRLVVVELQPRARPPRAQISLIEVAGRAPRALSPGPFDRGPVCAPDGSALAYVSHVAGSQERIVVRSPLLTGIPRIVGPGRDPAFSPDGQWIVYSAPVRRGTRTGWRLWRVRPDGTGRSPIGRGALDERRPAVSPDGRLVVYEAELERRPQLYARRLDGTGDRLLFAEGDAEGPVW